MIVVNEYALAVMAFALDAGLQTLCTGRTLLVTLVRRKGSVQHDCPNKAGQDIYSHPLLLPSTVVTPFRPPWHPYHVLNASLNRVQSAVCW